MQAIQPLVVPVEAPHELETVDELREVLLSEDEGRLVVVRRLSSVSHR